MSTRRPRSSRWSTPASRRTMCSSASTPTTRSGRARAARRAARLGWINTKMLDETGDEAKSQGWTPFILDTNGNGKRDEGYVEPNQPVDPDQGQAHPRRLLRRCRRAGRRHRSGARRLGYPGSVVRVDPPARTRPRPRSRKSTRCRRRAISPRGRTSTAKASVWAAARERTSRRASTAASAKVRSTARPRPASTAPRAGRSIRCRARSSAASPTAAAAEARYYTWVDQHDTLGLGKDVPIATGNQNDSLIALKDGKMINLVVPYPMGFCAKGLDGRIDDRQCRLEGPRRVVEHRQPHALPPRRRQGQEPKVVKFQLRPDPLAK